MPRSSAGRIVAGVAFTLTSMALALHGCREQPTEPERMHASAAASREYRLTLSGQGSTAGGTLTVSRGNVTCEIRSADGEVTTSGTCEMGVPKGTLVVVTAAPGEEGGIITWTGC